MLVYDVNLLKKEATGVSFYLLNTEGGVDTGWGMLVIRIEHT